MPTLDEWLNKNKDQEVSQKILAVSDVNPDLAAQSVKQARANNIPPALTPFEPDPDLAAQERLSRISSTLQSSPVLPKWMRQQPDVVVASVQDDVENMGAIDSLLDTPFVKGIRDSGRALATAPYRLTEGFYGAAAIPFGALRTLAEPFSGTRAQIPLLPVNPFVEPEQFFLDVSRGQKARADMIAGDRNEYGFVGQYALAGLESVGQSIPALAAAVITKNPSFATASLSTTVAGQQYAKAREKLDPLQAVSYGTLQGAIEYWTEKIPMSALIKSINADDTLLQTLGKQLATEIPGEQVATVLQDLNEWANLNPDKPFKDYIAERPEAAAGTLIATVVGVGGNVAITKTIGAFIERDSYAQKANETATLLGELNKLATASVVRERDVDTFEGFLQSVTQDTPVESLYIDAQTLIDSGLANKLASESPTVAAQIDQASAGTMIRIPTAEVMGRFNQELSPLLPEMRTDPNGMSQREAEEYVSTRSDELRTQVETVLSQNEEESSAQEARLAVRDTVAQELMATGRVTQDVADNYALLTSTFYHVMARRMGMNASELFGQERLRIAGAGRGEFEQGKAKIPAPPQLSADELNKLSAEQLEDLASEIFEDATYVTDDTRSFGPNYSIEDPLGFLYEYFEEKQGKFSGDWDAIVRDFVNAKIDVNPRKFKDILKASGRRIRPAAPSKKFLQAGALIPEGTTKIEVDGQMRPALNNEGKPIHPTVEGIRNFWRWFGDSKVVDAQGRPLVVYHGTPNKNFTQFRVGEAPGWGAGIYFTDNRSATEEFTGEDGRVIDAYVSIKNPWTNKDFSFLNPETSKAWEKVSKKYRDWEDAWDEDGVFVGELLRERGYDGIIVKDSNNIDGFEIVAFKNTQPKSVKNVGSFSPTEADIYKQGEAQEIRGSFSPSELTIRLTKAQDLSTFLHESGHFYLHMLVNLASRPDAPADVRKDAETILKWFGVKATPEMSQFDVWLNMSTDEQRPSHERFARGFEVYLAEGKAPSTELQPMFDRFRSWLLNVYRSLMERAKATFGKQVSFGKAMQAELNDEVRAVFDRLLATQEEIEAKEAAQSMGMMFKTEEEARKFGIDWQAYQAQGEAATQQAITELTAKSVQDMKWLENARSRMLSKLQREERDTRRSVRSAVRPEIMSQPIYRAWAYLTGPLTDDPNAEPTSRFDPEYVEQVTASKEVLAQLRKRRMVATSADIKNGVSGEHPDVVAETFGFSSGYELIEAILASPSPEEAINAETDARMLRDFSDLSTEEGRNDAVNAALANDARTRMVETELSALERAMSPRAMIGGRRQNTLPGAARNFARAVINRLKIRDVRVGQYSGSASRAAKNADRAIKKGNVQEAALEKRNQLVNTYAAKFAGEALDNVKRGVAYLKKFSKGGTRQNIDVEYLDQIDRILERFDLRPRTLRELDKRDALAKFVEDQKELGIEPDLPDYILNEAQAVNYKNLTVEEFAGLVDSIRQIEHLGRLKRKLLLAKDKREFDALMKEIRESVIANDRGRVADNRTRTDLGSIMSRAFKSFTAAHRKMASIVYEIDGFKDGGPLWDALVRTANERGNWEASKQAELTVRLAQLLKGLPKERAFSKGQFFPRIGTSLNQEGRLAVALNWGNEGNRQRLMDGRGWNAEGVQQVLDSLSQQEWDFVQGVWDTFESLRPDIAQVERNLMGKEPEWIEATPIQTKFGTYRGGYYPAVYDPAESLRTEQLSAEEEAKRQLRGARTAATVRSNFVKGRAAEVKGRPILLTMDATFNGLTDVVHYLAYKEWLVDANRILRAVDGTIRERYGAEMTRQLRTAVEAIAAGEATNPHALDKPLRHIRIGSMVAGLGFNIVNAVMQPLGLTQSIVRIGPKYIAQGVAEFAKNPVKLGTTVLEKSSFMRNRKRTQNRELNDLRNSLRGKTESRQFIDGAMFLPMTAIQMTVDIPTWWGAYQKAQTEGFDEDTSVQIADQAVLASQGGGQMKDLAAIQRGSEFVKIFTVFYGYFNTAYNLGVERIRGTNPRSPAQVARLATDLLLIYSVPAVMGALIKEAFKIGDDDDEEIAQKLAAEQVSFLFGTMVGVREAAGAAQIMFGLSTSGGLGYNGPAGLRFFNELNKFSQQANQGELDRAFVRAGVNVAGIALHLPSAQINRTIDGVIAMSEGRTQNPVALVGGAPPQ